MQRIVEPAEPRNDALFLLSKRALDIGICLLAALLLAPVIAAIVVAIKLTSPGPVFFRGIVHGKDGKPFTYYKFRSMVSGGDTRKHQEFIQNYVLRDAGHKDKTGKEVFKLTDDPRVTPVGKIIRRLSLDELPQMINVVRGEMSLVGPRPPVPYEYELYDDIKKLRLKVKPGITGLNQIRRRSQSSFQQMWDDDIEYIRRQSLALDLYIIVKTPMVMLFGSGPT
jgi:lipopolysaccharide/colanic/teichoic acid biosynthesis glycosyltransferase